MEIMMRLKGAGFSVIANEFRQREKRLGTGLPLHDFVEIVLQGLPKAKTPEEKYANVNALVDLFEDMDINGDGTMEFDEFTSYCVDAGMVATRNKTPTLKHRYVRCSKHVIKTMNGAVGIEKVKWSPLFKQFLVVENAAKSVKLFNADGKIVADVRAQSAHLSMAPRVGVGDVSPRGSGNDDDKDRRYGQRSRLSEAETITDAPPGAGAATSSSAAASASAGISILDAVFVFKFQCLAMSSTDFVISFYNLEEPKHHQRLPDNSRTSTMRAGPSYEIIPKLTITTTNAQLMLRFCEEAGLLFSAGNDFVVNVWKIHDLESKTLWKRLIHHQDMIMDIIEIPTHDLIASCDMNHTIQLWDIRDCRSRGALLGHTRGIKHMVFSKDHDMLLTAGFEFDAYGWDLASRQVVMKLVGHRAPLIGVQLALFQSERAVTGDASGVFKVWDISRAVGNGSHGASGGRQTGGRGASHAVLLESLDPSQQLSRFEPTAFVCLQPLSRDIWTAASGSATLHLFRSTRVQQFDEIPLRAFYHYNANRFVVVCGPVCSLWDGETGVCIDEFTHVGSSINLKKTPGTLPGGTSGSTNHNGTDSTHTSESTTDILLCTQDSRCKKLVVLSEEGEMGVFNCQNFVQMRRCEEAFKTQPMRWSQSADDALPTASCGIVGLHYCSENKIIIATDAHTSSILVIDDANSDSANGVKETHVLRRLIHIPGGIAASAYSYHASMIAILDEDSNTKISLWDFETLSFLGTCQLDDDDQDPNTTFTMMEFWDEYPVLLVADHRGGIYFFAVMPTKQANTGRLLHMFINDHLVASDYAVPEDESEDPEEGNSTPCTNETFMTEAAESAALKFLRKRKSLQKATSRRTDKQTTTQLAVAGPSSSCGSVTSMRVVCDDNDNQMRFLLFTGDERGVIRIWDLAQMMRRLSLFKIPETKCKYLRRGYHPRAMFSRDCTKETTSKRDSDFSRDISGSVVMSSAAFDTLGDVRFLPNQAQLKKLTKQRADAKKKSSVTSTGSALAELLAPNRVQPGHAPPSANTVAVAEAFLTSNTSSLRRQTKAPSRKESKAGEARENDGGATPAKMINVRTKPPEKHRRSVCLQNHDVSIVTVWYAHSDGIISLEANKNPNIIVTCSLDTCVFIWTWQGMCLGRLYDAENAARSKWRFHKDDSRREEERRLLVTELLHELELPPQQKAQRRRQTLYQDHVQRKSQKELPHVSVMLVDHIVSQHPEIAAMEQEGLSASSTDARINAEMEKMRQRNYNAKRNMLQMLKSFHPESTHPKDLARIHSLAQVGPLLCVDRFETKDELEQMKFIEKEELKMDRQYLEDELSITASAGADPRKVSMKSGNMDVIRSQIREAQKRATEMMENKVALQRHSMAMYSNLRQVQARYSISTNNPQQSVEALLLTKQTGIPLIHSDRAKQNMDMDELLEPSPFLRSKLPDSVLSTNRPQTAPSTQGNGVTVKRSATSHNSRASLNNGTQRLEAARRKLRPLTASASESSLIKPETVVGHRGSLLGGPSGVNRRSSLDLLYVEEARRQARSSSLSRRKSGIERKDEVTELESCPSTKKLDHINDVIDRAHAVGVTLKVAEEEDNDHREVSDHVDVGLTPSGRESQRSRPSMRSTPANLPTLHETEDSFCEDITQSHKRTDETTLRSHLEHTRKRMELAMRDSEQNLGSGGSRRSHLHKQRLAVEQLKKEKRMEDYLQQKRRELNTNIGSVFKRTSFAFPSAGLDDGKTTMKLKPGPTSTRHHRSILEAQVHVERSKVFGIYGVKEVMSIIRLFNSMDEDGSGVLTLPELLAYKGYFEKLGYHDMATVFQAIDKDGSGSITLKELLEICFQYATKNQIEEMLKLAKLGDVASYFDATKKRRGRSATKQDESTKGAEGQAKPNQELSPEDRAELRAIFHVFDRDGDGGVSMEEIIEALHVEEDEVMARVTAAEEADLAKRDAASGSPKRRPSVSVAVSPAGADKNKSSAFTKAEIQKIYEDFDTDGNRTLDFDEFVALMRTIYGPRAS